MRRRVGRVVRGAAGFVVVGLVVEVASRAGLVSPSSVPPTTAVLSRCVELMADPTFLFHVLATLVECAIGLGVALLVALPSGLLLGWFRGTYLAAAAAIEMLRPIPSVALIPLVILVLGRGLDMKVVLVAYAATWPILVNTLAAVRSVDRVTIDTGRVYSGSRAALLWSVVLPAVAPFAVTGLRVSAGIALIVAISAELLAGGSAGIGTWVLSISQPGVPRELLYAGIVVIGLLGLAVNGILVAAERRLFAWHHGLRGAP